MGRDLGHILGLWQWRMLGIGKMMRERLSRVEIVKRIEVDSETESDFR